MSTRTHVQPHPEGQGLGWAPHSSPRGWRYGLRRPLRQHGADRALRGHHGLAVGRQLLRCRLPLRRRVLLAQPADVLVNGSAQCRAGKRCKVCRYALECPAIMDIRAAAVDDMPFDVTCT
jgi:hypothetical protein